MFRTNDLSSETLFVEDLLNTGTTNDENYSTSKQNPTTFIVGGGYTQGQEVRSLASLNNNGPDPLPPSDDDKEQALGADPLVFTTYPTLVDYPYFTVDPPDPTSVIEDSTAFPVWRSLGRGRGVVNFFSSGPAQDGDPSRAYEDRMSWYYSSGVDAPIRLSELYVSRIPRWPYSGIQSSGFIVQMVLSDTKITVIPYQAGRGIPQYDPTDPYFSGNAYGTPMVPNTDIPLEPMLSEGAISGANVACLGVTLESKGRSLWKYPVIGSREFWEPWDAHIAPFRTPAKSVSLSSQDTRIMSPLNSAGTYWAPWTQYYSYGVDDPIGVLTEGPVTMSVGGSTNIGAQAYYVPDVEEGDDPRGNPKYVSVSIVPLFQGEEVLVGSQVYATAQGVSITPLPQGRSPYPIVSYVDANGNLYYDNSTVEFPIFESLTGLFGTQMDGRRCNPYYDYFDVTYGSVGWTSTPQMVLRAIPDQGVTIASTRNPSNPQELPYLAQSLQGTVFVMGRTVRNPLDSDGSGRGCLVGPSHYVTNEQVSAVWYRREWDRWSRIDRLPGVPGRSLSVGGSLMGIRGTGEWPYTGVLNDTEQVTFIEGGVGYEVMVYNTRTTGDGSGMTIDVTAVDSVGTITTYTVNSVGSGYAVGDIVYIIRDVFTAQDFEWGTDALTWYQNTAHLVVTGPGTVTMVGHGTSYRSESYVPCYNLSVNNMVVFGISFQGYYEYNSKVRAMVTGSHMYVSDYSQYPVGTKVLVVAQNVHRDNWAEWIVIDNDGSTTISFLYNKAGGLNAYEPTLTFIYNTEIVGWFAPIARVLTDSSGYVISVDMVNVPPRNDEDDILLLVQEDSQKNCIFGLDFSSVTLFPRLITGGADYWWDDSPFADARTGSLFTGFGGPFNLSPNTVDVYEGGVSTGLSGTVGATNELGSVTNVYFPHNIGTFTGQFGETQTLYQTYPFDISAQPVAGAQPSAGWPSYVYRRTATYYQDLTFVILSSGTGYAVGDSISVTGGTGAGMVVWVTKVDDDGGVVAVRLRDIGQGYLMDDVVDLDVGGCQLVLRFPPSKEINVFITDSSTTSFPNVSSILYWDAVILTGGTGYVVGTETATCDAPVASDLDVNILVVSGGVVQDMEIVIPNGTTIISNNQLDYVYTVTTGGTGCTFRLGVPRKAQPFVMTKGGTGYTTADGVSTLNITANNMNLIADFSVAGQCLAIDYGVTDTMPLTNNLARYTVGDVLAYDQDGNVSATAEILTLDPTTQSITFNQVTNGVGYVAPAGNYGFVPTINTSDTATTVDIVADASGVVTSVSINTLGTNVQFGDILLVESGDYNAVVRLESERDVPPQWQESENNRLATAGEWNDYATVMKSAVNLLDQDLLVDMKRNYPWYYNQSYYYYGDPDNKDPNGAGWTENPGSFLV